VLARADTSEDWIIEVDNGGRSAAAGLQLDVSLPADGGLLTVGSSSTSASVGSGRSVAWQLPLTAGDQVTVATDVVASSGCAEAILLRPDGSLARRVTGCGPGYVEAPVPIVLEQPVDTSGTWQVVVINDSFPQPFTVEAST
jgi:hypothetical protein